MYIYIYIYESESDTYMLVFKIYITLTMSPISLVECDIKIYKLPIIWKFKLATKKYEI